MPDSTLANPTTDQTDTPTDRPLRETHKVRKCLRCETTFRSEWAGERICSHCKNSTAWRNETPFRPRSSRRDR